MENSALDRLLEELNAGDFAAAEQVYLSYEPYLRMVVRRRLSQPLRSKFDSSDIVQSVWADLLAGLRQARWRFTEPAQLRAFLIKMTRNRLIDRLRRHRGALAREVPWPDQDDIPATATLGASRPSELFYADELWRQMLEMCPEAHRELLHLKRQGASLAEIAQRTGLHEGSVRRVLYGVARRVTRMRAMAGQSNGQ